jgi:hypothetical protein
MWRVPCLIAILILFAGPSLVQSKTLPSPKCSEYGRGLRVCTELDDSALSRPGRSTKWRVWVEGDGSPIQVRLHNNSPGVVRLKGGDDQIVHMGCRRHHEVRRKVTAIGPGVAKLEGRPYSPSPKQESATIAAALAPLLARIEAEFAERRARLSGAPNYSSEAVTELLDTTEAELLQALSYQELAALRDYVREQFRQARADLKESRTEKGMDDLPFPFSSQVVVASMGPLLPLNATSLAETPREAVSKTTSESVLDRIKRMLRQLTEMASQNNLVTSLCVTSGPGEGAKFLMRPQGIKQWTKETITASYLSGIYRGIYVYKISKGLTTKNCDNPDKEDCALIDLVDDRQPIFHCDLKSKACARKPGPLPTSCQSHG